MGEVKTLLRLALPLIVTSTLNYLSKLSTILIIGHLSPDLLAAAALAVMFSNVFGFSILVGLSSALDTLATQGMTASRDPKYLGVLLQRGVIIATFLCLPIGFIWVFCEDILIFLGQDPRIAALSGRYILFYLPSLIPSTVFNVILKYLNAQSIMSANLYICLVTLPISVILQYSLVHYTPLSFCGAPLAASITEILNLILISLYVAYINGYQPWGGFTKRAWAGWGEYLNLGLPGCLMCCAEWWAFELCALAAGMLLPPVAPPDLVPTFSTPTISPFQILFPVSLDASLDGAAPTSITLSIQSILLTICSVSYMFYLGLSIANATRVGNLIGASLPHQAQKSATTSLILGILMALCNSTILILTKDYIPRLFTEDSQVVFGTSQLIPLAALFQVFDGVSCVAGGILRGLGKQVQGAAVNLFSYYVIALPLGFTLAFRFGYGLWGIWIGLVAGLGIAGCVFWVVLKRVDWEGEVVKARERVDRRDEEILDNDDIEDDDGLFGDAAEDGRGLLAADSFQRRTVGIDAELKGANTVAEDETLHSEVASIDDLLVKIDHEDGDL